MITWLRPEQTQSNLSVAVSHQTNPEAGSEQVIALRPPSEVMRLSRLGSLFAHRLSFMRILMRVLCAERPQLIISSQQLDEDGYGHMILTLNAWGRP